jgi:hypothetical protein
MWARAAALAAALLALGAVPWSDNPLYRLAGGGGDSSDARFDAPLDPSPLRAFDEGAEPDTPYFVDAAAATPLEQGNLKAAGQLYLAPLLPVLDRSRAETFVRLRDGRILVE